MDIKTIHDNQVQGILNRAKSLDKETKAELIDYLNKTIEFMKKDLVDEPVDWSSLEYLKGENARNFFESDMNDYTIGWKLDEQEIIDFDKQVLQALQSNC